MTLTPGTRLGVYEITAPLGEGGMGQVWRARDTKLDRDVALKVLPAAFAHDADRLARFTREAKTLAAVPVQTTPTFSAGTATTLFETRYFVGGVLARTFDVSPDGQRFLMIKGAAAEQAPTMVVVLNWLEELEAKLPTR